MSVLKKFKQGLARSHTGFLGHLNDLFGPGEVNALFFEELEEILISGDVGVDVSFEVVKKIEEEAQKTNIKKRADAKLLLIRTLTAMMQNETDPFCLRDKPHLVLLVGVNGSGKTTSAAKLANLYHQMDKKVLLVAGDTYRAAAIEQLEIWAQRAKVDLIKQQAGSDPSALFFDALNSARARETDVIIGDTAGRLHNKYNLMEELNKIYRVIGRNMPGAPHQVLLVVDATTGQNAIAQAKSFSQSLPLNGLILTKLDGTARGGIVISIQSNLDLPVYFVGTGEKIEDLVPFNASEFIHALLER